MGRNKDIIGGYASETTAAGIKSTTDQMTFTGSDLNVTASPGTNAVSSGNSSTTPLGGGATFTGTNDTLTNSGIVAILVFADQAGTLNVDWSTDGSNYDLTDSLAVSASAGASFTLRGKADNFRIRYVNGGVAQSVFRLETLKIPFGQPTDSELLTALAKIPAQGAAVIAASTPVNVASDQTVPVSAASLPLPAGAATEATLATIDADTSTLAGTVVGSEQQVDIVSAGPVMLDATGAAIGSDTSSIDGKTPALGAAVIAASSPVNIASDQTVPVSAASLPLPAGAATEATLATIDADTSLLAGTVSGTEQQVDIVASLPAGSNNIGDVDIASALPAGSNNIGEVDLNRLDVVDLIDDLGDGSGIVFAANDNIDDSAGTFLTIVASTAATIQALQVADTTGGFIGLFTGPAASEVLKLVIAPGSDQTIEAAIPAGTRLSVRRMDSATVPLTAGFLAINFLG